MVSCAACPNAAVLQWTKVDPADPNGTVPVYACADHSVSLDLAAMRHQSTCTAPNAANLPGCDCTPFVPA
jgi:hypothetical protein